MDSFTINDDIKQIPYTCIQRYINHTPYTIFVDHCASIQVRVMVHSTDNDVDYCFAKFGMCNGSCHGKVD